MIRKRASRCCSCRYYFSAFFFFTFLSPPPFFLYCLGESDFYTDGFEGLGGRHNNVCIGEGLAAFLSRGLCVLYSQYGKRSLFLFSSGPSISSCVFPFPALLPKSFAHVCTVCMSYSRSVNTCLRVDGVGRCESAAFLYGCAQPPFFRLCTNRQVRSSSSGCFEMP